MSLIDDVRAALGAITDPILDRTLDDLEMVREVRVDGAHAVVEVALPSAAHPEIDGLAEQIGDAVKAVAGIESVHIDYGVMTSDEQARLRDALVGGAGRSFNDRYPRTRVLGISSGKGGVGKSSVTVNTAVALHRRGHRVAILDADVYGFSVPKMLGIDRPPMQVADLIVPPKGHGVACISMGFFAEEDAAVVWRGPMLHKALEQFLLDVWWGEPDYLLVDMPPGTGDIAISMAQHLPRTEIYVVTTPQPAAQRVAQRTAAMAKKVNLDVFGIIENMAWFTGDDSRRYELFGAGGGEALATQLDVPLVAQVPFVPALREGGDEGRPVTVADPAGEVATAFDAIAQFVEAHGPRKIFRRELRVR
ncbi:MAG TPA: Mrp/NBP35 family ATP-binding protein [Acidimicrobiales bacterium]|nr:Mrp/NBP35 family ATP-binding protein [Acidimicrobiales bacterium]